VSDPGDEESVQFAIQPRITKTMEMAADWLAEVVDQDLGLKQGKTCFYWAIIALIQQHAKEEDSG
jgi:hypothetical protein